MATGTAKTRRGGRGTLKTHSRSLPRLPRSATTPRCPMTSFRASWASCAMMGIAAVALEWTILATARTDDTLGFTWSEVDTEKGLWTIPGARMKADADHRV